MLEHLFSKCNIGSLALKNRVIMPAMGSLYPDIGGFVSERLVAFHVARAKGGCGMNIVEITAVHPTSKAPRNLSIYDDSFIPGLARLAEAIKSAGGRAAIQLWHAGRQTFSRWTGSPLVSSSPIPCPLCKEKPTELTVQGIREIVDSYGDAAARAKKAGFDAVEIHGAHGYLIAQFMSSYSNKRNDEYGGPLVNRMRFALEIVKNVRDKVGSRFPLLYRLSADEYVRSGLKIEDTILIAKSLEEAGIDAVHVSAGVYETLERIIPPLDFPVALNVDNASAVKSAVKIPVIAALRINDPILADRIIGDGKADLIAVGRGHLADPEFCNKAKFGKHAEIIKCIGCNQGCVDRLFVAKKPISCLRNAATGREQELEIKLAEQKKIILIVGGGPAGLESSTILKKRGHEVIVLERESRLGGQFFLAGAAPRKSEMAAAASRMGEIAVNTGVDVRLSTPLTRRILAEIGPHEIVVATGSRPIIPEIEGIGKPHVTTGHEVLENRGTSIGKSVAIIGGGLIGMEVAELLCSAGKKITMVEMLDKIANGLGPTRRPLSIRSLEDNNVQVYVKTKCLEIKDESIIVERDGECMEIKEIDSVVIAVGVKPDRSIEALLAGEGYPYHVIGDARDVGKALDAIWEGSDLGRSI